MNKKSVGIGAAGVAGATVVATVLTVSNPNTTQISGNYRISEVSPYRAEVHLSVPDTFTPDIVTLKLNDMEITKCLLPTGYLITYPTVVSDIDRLSLDMYVRNEEAAVATFNADGTLTITVKNEYLKGSETNTPTVEPTEIATEELQQWHPFGENVVDVDLNVGGETTDVE